MNRLKFIACLGIAASAACCSAEAYDFYVSPKGNNANPGTKEKPFASIDQARLAVQKLKKTKQDDIFVGIHGGSYSHRETTVFSMADSGSAEQKITYEAIGEEVPVLTSEVPVVGWSKVAKPAKGVPSKTKSYIWSAPVPEGLGRIKYLYQDDAVLFRSMTPGFEPPVRFNSWRGNGGSRDRQYMTLPKDIAIADWTDIQDMELCILPTCDWTMYNLPLESIDLDEMVVKAAFESSYGLGRQKKKTWEGTPTAWFANCPEGMLEPGNWYVNTRENKIYLVRKNKPEGITAPSLLEYIKVEGDINPEGDEDQLVENIHFKGLVFTKGQRYTWDHDHLRKNLQHEWERHDAGNALLRFRNTKNCFVKACRFEHSGAAAIRLDLSSQHNRIEGNWIRRMGGTGIVVAGYGIGFKNTSFKNQIIGNHIHHIGEAYFDSSAIIVFQSEANRIANNYIHHTPYNAITITGPRDLSTEYIESGQTALIDVSETFGKQSKGEDYWKTRFTVLHSRDNIFEYNEIHHAVNVMGDGNAYYMSGCGSNNTFRCNYIHHQVGSHASAAARTDGVTHYANFYNNVFYKITKSGLVLKYAGHKAVNNIFVDSYDSTKSKGWEGGTGWLELRSGPSYDTVIKNNIFFDSSGEPSAFLGQKVSSRLKKVDYDEIEFSGNIFDGKGMSAKEGASFVDKMEGNKFSGVAHKKLTAISVVNDRVQINMNDPLFRQGYEAVDMSRMGVPETFPDSWLKYEEHMPMQKLFIAH